MNPCLRLSLASCALACSRPLLPAPANPRHAGRRGAQAGRRFAQARRRVGRPRRRLRRVRRRWRLHGLDRTCASSTECCSATATPSASASTPVRPPRPPARAARSPIAAWPLLHRARRLRVVMRCQGLPVQRRRRLLLRPRVQRREQVRQLLRGRQGTCTKASDCCLGLVCNGTASASPRAIHRRGLQCVGGLLLWRCVQRGEQVRHLLRGHRWHLHHELGLLRGLVCNADGKCAASCASTGAAACRVTAARAHAATRTIRATPAASRERPVRRPTCLLARPALHEHRVWWLRLLPELRAGRLVLQRDLPLLRRAYLQRLCLWGTTVSDRTCQ